MSQNKLLIAATLLAMPTLVAELVSFLNIPLNKPDYLSWFLRSVINIHHDLVGVLPVSWRKQHLGVVSQLRIHPVKSLSGISVQTAEIDEFGFKYDRMYMMSVFDEKKQKYEAVTQRQYPKMTLVKPSFENGWFVFTYPRKDSEDVGTFRLPMVVDDAYLEQHSKTSSCEDTDPVVLWNVDFNSTVLDVLPEDFLLAVEAPLNTKLLYSKRGKEVVTNKPSTRILQDSRFTKFQDYFPSLIMTEEDFDDINNKLVKDGQEVQITSTNFRPNLVVAGTPKAYDSDDWSMISIGGEGKSHDWYITSKCPRCAMPNVNPQTGEFYETHIISKLLAKFRRVDPGCTYYSFLGMCGVQLDYGYSIHVGDKVTLFKRRLNQYKFLQK